MKKRSMLAIASLATGFVVAAVTPSHALGEQLSGLTVGDTVSSLDPVLAHDSLDTSGGDAAGGDASGEQEN
ncbi:hypothetical protein AB0K92_10640 [Streptomyces sp. NPDC052687]|uniref:hypothetical protein n=1 Tax=Streptomyces sp. NPDC052687 TaxID=3154759 RepID=UPI00342F01E9